MYSRPTAMAAAFINAVAKKINAGEVDHQTGKGNWIARRIAIDAEQGRKIGIVTDYDRSPRKPQPSMAAAMDRNISLTDGEEGHFD